MLPLSTVGLPECVCGLPGEGLQNNWDAWCLVSAIIVFSYQRKREFTWAPLPPPMFAWVCQRWHDATGGVQHACRGGFEGMVEVEVEGV